MTDELPEWVALAGEHVITVTIRRPGPTMWDYEIEVGAPTGLDAVAVAAYLEAAADTLAEAHALADDTDDD